ncbi:sulfite exporter TauE/SafE family protein [Rhodobacteraceae bacterium 2376]|uniref:Probable membrane transporter protein n=1 Tax=Rhabdonatronobacter sediminivivens TaxID=2743469 RepID=A0A7Z0HYI7_9RHOB|nr:sulfite exporter TauE/SafE family protein [Rhabdonatronobacter sediminivivens]NYS24654.1 sulfite exporter TauE/SafE family protein [Rhabdonatronobacter sediminivivens]
MTDTLSALLALTLFDTPAALTAAVVAVSLVGLSKGGLGGAFALMGVPVLSLVMPPVQAAALLLPILLMMDAVGLWTWRHFRDWAVLRAMLPAAMLGIFIGWMAAAYTSEALVRLLVGLVALGFVLYVALPRRSAAPVAGHRPVAAWIWGSSAGFTSFVAHAGSPPFQIYTLPLRLDPKVFTGTAVVFFAVNNLVKVVPYAALGQFDTRTLWSAALMLPLAVVAVLAGAMIVRRMRAAVFYPFMYAMVALVSVKLIHDGVRGLLGGV